MKYFIAFIFIAGLCFVGFASQTKATGSYAPRLGDVYISDTAYLGADSFPSGTIDTLVASGTTEIHINGRVQDSDGYLDIDHVEVVFYRSGVQNAALCTANTNNCYQVAECDLMVDDYYHQQFDCHIDLWYYADATDFGSQYPGQEWNMYLEVFDSASASDTHSTTRKELSSMMAADVDGEINYGDLWLGDVTTADNNASLTIRQAGNREVDIEVLSTGAMQCESGTIPTENQAWSLEDVGFENSTLLTETAADTGLELENRVHNQSNPTGTIYWNLSVPEEGVGGDCVGTVSVTAVNS